jgi:hypothetical protein
MSESQVGPKMTESLPIIKNEIYRGLSKLVVALLLDVKFSYRQYTYSYIKDTLVESA